MSKQLRFDITSVPDYVAGLRAARFLAEEAMQSATAARRANAGVITAQFDGNIQAYGWVIFCIDTAIAKAEQQSSEGNL